MNIKVQKAPFNSNLVGAALFAFAVLESKLVTSIGQSIGRSTWELACNGVSTLIAGMDAATASNAIEKYKSDAIKALESREVRAQVDAAGLGDISSIQTGDDGKQTGLGKDARHIERLYGAKFKLGPQIDKATTTIKQYCDNLRIAVEMAGKIETRITELKATAQRSDDEQRELDALAQLDVTYKGKTVQQVVRQNRDASEAFSPAKLAARRDTETSRRVGQSFTDFYKKADDQLRGMLHNVNAILDGWEYVDADARSMAILAIDEQAEIFHAAKVAHEAAEAAASAEGQSASEQLPNVPETSDESVHAQDTDGAQGAAEPQRAAA